MPTTLCPAGLTIQADHDHNGAPRHVMDLSFCNHPPRPDGLPTEVMVGVDDVGHVALIDEDPDSVVAWLTHRGPNSRVFRAALTYRSEITLIPPTTVERPVTWS